MDYQAAATIIDRNSGLYDITTNEGRERRRLFFSTQGYTLSNFIVYNCADIQCYTKLMVYSWCTN